MARIVKKLDTCIDGKEIVRAVVAEKVCLYSISTASKSTVAQFLDAVWEKGGVARVAALRCLMYIHSRVDLRDAFRQCEAELAHIFCGLMTLLFLPDMNRLKLAIDGPSGEEEAPRKRLRLETVEVKSSEDIPKCQPGKRTCNSCWWKCDTEGMMCTAAVAAALGAPFQTATVDEVCMAGCMQLLRDRLNVAASRSRAWVGEKQVRVLIVVLRFCLERGESNSAYLLHTTTVVELIRDVLAVEGRGFAALIVPAGVVPLMQKCAETVHCPPLVLAALGTLRCVSPFAAPASLQDAHNRFMTSLSSGYVYSGVPMGQKARLLSGIYHMYHCGPHGFPGVAVPGLTEELALFWESCLMRVVDPSFHVVIFQHISNWVKGRALVPSGKAEEILARTLISYLEAASIQPGSRRPCLFWPLATIVDCTSLFPVVNAVAIWDGLPALLQSGWSSQCCGTHRPGMVQSMFILLAFVARVNFASHEHIVPIVPMVISELKVPGISIDMRFSGLQLLFMLSASHKHFRVVSAIPMVCTVLDVVKAPRKAPDTVLRMALWLLQRITQWPVRGDVSIRHVIKTVGGNAVFTRLILRLAYHENPDVALSAREVLERLYPENDFMTGGAHAKQVCMSALTPFEDPKMECPVCLVAGGGPLVFLPCLHYFCVACVESAFSVPAKCVCPVCRDPVLVSINRP